MAVSSLSEVIWSGYLTSILIKGAISGLIGSLDSISMIVAHPGRIRWGRFCVMWGLITGSFHFIIKMIAGSTAMISPGNPTLPGILVRVVAIGLAGYVVRTTWTEIQELGKSACDLSRPHKYEQWTFPAVHLWLPAALLGAIDAGPIGFFKGLMVADSGPLILALNCLAGSTCLALITIGVAFAVDTVEQRIVNESTHVGIAGIGRLLHFGAFCWLGMGLFLELAFLVLRQGAVPTGWLILPPIITAAVIAVYLRRPTGRYYRLAVQIVRGRQAPPISEERRDTH